MQMLNDIASHPKQKEIEHRLKIIAFFDRYGAAATREAFNISRSTVYLWKKRLKAAGGKLSSLAPGNKAPLTKRKRHVPKLIEEFIIKYRTEHPGVDKLTITPLLKVACMKAGINPPSESTVGRIIHDLKQKNRLPRHISLGINGRTGKLHVRNPKPRMAKVRRKGFWPKRPGELVEIDTIDIFVDGLKRYLITAIDLPTRFAFAYIYKTSSSACARDFLAKLTQVAPFKITRVQTDNGHEFLKHFSHACQQQGLIHYFNYPRHPQSNAHMERFNRTIQEQFTHWHSDFLDDISGFNQRLMKYLLWYNTERPHRSIGKIPPLLYYVLNFFNPEKSNMYWTLTRA